jgi:type I restriction enzyme S subunit
MAGEWKISTLGEIADASPHAFVDGPFGSNLPASCYTDAGVPIIPGSNLSLGETRFRSDEFVYVSDETANRLQRSCCKPLDIVFTKKGTLGQTGIVPENGRHQRYLLSGNQMKLTVDRSKADPLFVFYFVSSPPSRTKIVQDSEVTGVPKTNLTYLRTFPIPLPPLAEQKAIAAVLGALDDKIELNRRMNATLEAMARALFQSWFVDFDPVRAKLDGRPPAALDPATAALFPDSFDETELGHTPHGWEVKTLGEVIELAYGKPLKAEDRKNGSVCVYGANGPVGWHDEKLVSGPGIVVGRKGNPGVVTWAHGDFYPIDTTFYVAPIGACRSLYFLYYALSLHNLANLSADSAVPGLNRNHAYMSKQVIPSQPVLTAFDSQIAPIFAAIHANLHQSRTLATLRDTLLPKLLSGELSVASLDAKPEAAR